METLKGWRRMGVGLATLWLLGCKPGSTEFVCDQDSDCRAESALTGAGTCEPTGYCSFPDTGCFSGRRYGEFAPFHLAGFCVPPDAGETETATEGGSGEDSDPTPGSDCGNGVAEGDELCDGTDLAGSSCTTEGFAGGALGCTEACTLDTSTCNACGNGAIDPGEACDGNNLGSVSSCADVGLGTDDEALQCSASCKVDYANCSACGDGMITAPEECDASGELGGATCAGEGFGGGALACTKGCTFDTSGCAACGNNVREPGEACDGPDVGAATCESEGFEGGALQCDDDCMLDTTSCGSCGNGAIDGDEACDQLDLGGQTCQGLGFFAGTLGCAGDCTFDTGGCEGQGCGDGIANGSEDCDGADLNGQSCVSQGFGGGVLSCNGSCDFVTSSCDACGDGSIDPGEECDGGNLGGGTCVGEGFDGGSLACSSCSYDTSGCYACGDGDLDPGETCDDGDGNDNNQCNNDCEYNTVQVTMTTGGNIALFATLDASCPLTGAGCSMDAGGTLAGWEAMETPGCGFLCPVNTTIDIHCTTGGATNRDIEDIEEQGGTNQSQSCAATPLDCSATFNIGTLPIAVRCAYTD